MLPNTHASVAVDLSWGMDARHSGLILTPAHVSPSSIFKSVHAYPAHRDQIELRRDGGVRWAEDAVALVHPQQRPQPEQGAKRLVETRHIPAAYIVACGRPSGLSSEKCAIR